MGLRASCDDILLFDEFKLLVDREILYESCYQRGLIASLKPVSVSAMRPSRKCIDLSINHSRQLADGELYYIIGDD